MERLKEIFSLELKLYAQILELLRREKTLLLNRAGSGRDSVSRIASLEAMHEISLALDAAVVEARDLELEKEALVKNLSTGRGSEAATLDGLIGRPDFTELAGLHTKALALAASIRETGRENGLIIARTLTNIKNAVDFLKGLSGADTYHADGRLTQAGSVGPAGL